MSTGGPRDSRRARLSGWRKLATRVACVLPVVAIAACGSGGDTSSGKTEAVPDQVTVGFSDKIITLDPDQAGAIPDVSALHLIGGNLYRLTPTSEAVPGLAEKGTISDDQLTWTFTLRPGLKFSDGTPLTSTDVVATLRRMKTDKASFYGAYMESVETIQAEGPSTVRVDLHRPYPSLPTVLAEPLSAIMPADGLKNAKQFFANPVSAGPYMLKSWGESNTLVMVPNPHYWGQKPEIAQITFSTVPDANDRLAQTQAGQLDLGVDLPPSVLAQMAPAQPQVAKTFGFFALSTNTKVGPTDEIGVRKAINLAVDRAQIVETVFSGDIEPLAGFWPPTYPGYDPRISTARDVEAARKELAGTKCAQGCTIPLLYTESYAWSVPAATIVQSNLKEIGIDVRLENVDFTTYFNKLIEGKTPLSLTFVYDYSNVPDGLLTYGLGESNAQWSYFKSPELSKLIAATDESSGAELKENLARVNDLFVKQTPYVTLTAGAYVNAARFPKSLYMGSSGLIDVPPAL